MIAALLLLGCDVGAPPNPGNTAEQVFEVPKGSSARGLGDELAAAGLVGSENDWSWFLRLGADGSCLKAGKHRVSPSMPAEELLRALCGAPIPDDVPFTVLEGWRARDIDAALAAAGLVPAGSYLTATSGADGYTTAFPLPSRDLEGYLFPETYQVSPGGFTARAFVQRQLDLFGERFGANASGRLGGRSLDEVVIVASMLEREEPALANRPLVAGVIWKRLDAKWTSGSTPPPATCSTTGPTSAPSSSGFLTPRTPTTPACAGACRPAPSATRAKALSTRRSRPRPASTGTIYTTPPGRFTPPAPRKSTRCTRGNTCESLAREE